MTPLGFVRKKNYFLIHGALLAGLVAVALVSLCVGRFQLPLADILGSLAGIRDLDPRARTVLWDVRLPRVLLSAAVGAGLSASGVSLQALFGNPLVSSHILGVSSSAAFGAALALLLVDNFTIVQLSAVVFGFLGMAVTYAMSRRKGTTSVLMLVLSGVIVSAVFEAFTALVKYLADTEQKLPAITYWLMGSLAGATNDDLLTGIPPIALALGVLWWLRWPLNVISLREDEAISLGINVRRVRILVILATTVITAISVSLCGVIAFLGLAVPHLARMLVGNDHKHLLPACVLLGGAFLAAIDTIARSATAAEIPLSILTATIGAPFFAVLLRRTGGSWND